MLRRIKTHVNYKKDGVVIRPATLHEEYDIGNWTTYYVWIKLGYEYSEYESLYSDIMYVMTINGSLIGYFLAYNSINIGDNPNIPLYNKEMVVYDLVVDVRAYAKYTKIFAALSCGACASVIAPVLEAVSGYNSPLSTPFSYTVDCLI